jgi:hypothetical protein
VLSLSLTLSLSLLLLLFLSLSVSIFRSGSRFCSLTCCRSRSPCPSHTSTQVLELPAKHVYVVYAQLTPMQLEYTRYIYI